MSAVVPTPVAPDARRTWWRAFGLVALWLLATVWVRPLMLPDEGRYAGVALEMLRAGDWLVPTLDGLPYFHKPVLFYWITAAGLELFGRHAYAARLAPFVGALLMAAFTALYAQRRWGPAAADAVLGVLATMPFFFLAAQYANLDMLVAGCITATVVAWTIGVEEGSRRWLLAGWVLMALGVLAKGLIGIVLPMGVVLLTPLAAEGLAGWRSALRRAWQLAWWPGPLLGLVVGAPWFLAVEQRHPGFLQYFFIHHHFQRFAQGGFNNEHGAWFYPAVILLATLPWWPWLLRRGGTALAGQRASLWLWLAVPLVFFSLPRSKLAGYVLPVLPALALLIVERHRERLASRGWKLTLLGGALLCVVAVVLTARHERVDTNAALVRALEAQAAPGEPVYAIEMQPYDVGLHSRATRPVRLVTDWAQARAQPRDDWRAELIDASRFAPEVAAQVLLMRAQAEAQWCAAGQAWVMIGRQHQPGDVLLRGLAPVASNGKSVLLRLDRAALAPLCRGTPNAG